MNSIRRFLMIAAVLAMTLMSNFTATGFAAPAPTQVSPKKIIAFLPVLQAPMERDTCVSQILTNAVLDFATEKKAILVDDALLDAVLKKNHYIPTAGNQPIDLALIKKIQQDTGADLVVAVRVEALSEASGGNSSSSTIMVRPAVTMQLVAASASQEKAWQKRIDAEEWVDYSIAGALGPERLADSYFTSFLRAAWHKI